MADRRYVILTLEDARDLAGMAEWSGEPSAVRDRLMAETGADIEAIAAALKKLSLCPACVIEAQERSCYSHDARKLGRRLNRLLMRARGEVLPGETTEDAMWRTDASE